MSGLRGNMMSSPGAGLALRGYASLLAAAFIWGTTFVAQMEGMDELGPFSYAASRFFLGFCSLGLLWLASGRGKGRGVSAAHFSERQSGWRVGLVAGLIMFVASSMQQVAMLYTTAGKTAFITCLYIIFVPIASVMLHRRIRGENWAGALLALTGLYLLAMHGPLALGLGDAIVLVSALWWTGHILYIGRFAAHADAIEVSMVQIGVCAALSFAVAMGFEEITWQAVRGSAFPIFYGGVMSAGVAFTLQIVGQRYVEPSHAAILMSFESIFGALGGWLILGEAMTGREATGCVLMFAGMVTTQAGGLMRRGAKRS